jgi:hypothetical protein
MIVLPVLSNVYRCEVRMVVAKHGPPYWPLWALVPSDAQYVEAAFMML